MEATIIIKRLVSLVGQGTGFISHCYQTIEENNAIAQLQADLMTLPVYSAEGKIGRDIDLKKFFAIRQNVCAELGNVTARREIYW